MKTYKIEMIIAQLFLNDLLSALKTTDIKGYTCIPVQQSMGINEGELIDDPFNDSMKKVLVFSIVSKTELDQVLEAVQNVKERFRILSFYTEIDGIN